MCERRFSAPLYEKGEEGQLKEIGMAEVVFSKGFCEYLLSKFGKCLDNLLSAFSNRNGSGEGLKVIIKGPAQSRRRLPQPAEEGNEKILLLLLKADLKADEDIVSKLKSTKRLSGGDVRDLYLATQSMWVGTADEYRKSDCEQDFDKEECRGEVPSLDFYVFKFVLKKRYEPDGYAKDADDDARKRFFRSLCNDGLEVEKVSGRLNYRASTVGEVAWNR